MYTMITSFFLIIYHSCRCFQTTIYSLQNFLRHIIITATTRVLQKFYHHYHGDCRILANGMWICHLECHYHFTTILGRGPWSNYPQHCLWMHLHQLLLDTYQSHTMPTIWRCFIWMFCYCTKCSIHPTVITSRWGLQEWFWHQWFTNTLVENSSHTPHIQHGPCLLQPCGHYTLHYTSQYSQHYTL